METLFNRRCQEILHVESVKQFSKQITEFTLSVGLEMVGATVITDHSLGLTEFQSVTNAPAGYLDDFRDIASARLDPVSQHCKRASSPIVWDQQFYVARGRADFWEHQAHFGLRSGISIAFHLPRGRHFLFGATSDEYSCGSEKRVRDLTIDIRQFAAYAQAAAFDLCIPYERDAGEAKLARGELEALQRSADGLSEWEIGREMSISETEAAMRLQRAMRKLGCSNKYETALRGIRLGLVHCD
jgi:DNA-binding CsgD family transcriptional regulator